MKNQASKSKSLLLSLLLIVGLSFSLTAQELKKEVKGNYKVTKDYTLGIVNKYGTIDIVNWDKNELEVVVEMIVKAPSDEKAQKLLDKINVKIEEMGNGVDFITEIEAEKWGDKSSIEVKYKVNAPTGINVKLVQAYGSIFIQEITGHSNIIVKYGNLKAQSLGNESNDLIMAYSDGVIKNGGTFSAKVTYSDITFGSVKEFDGKLAYSGFIAKNLSGKLVTNAAYSNIEIASISKGFELIDASVAYGDVKLMMEENASYNYDLKAKFGSLDIPSDMKSKKDTGDKHGPDLSESAAGSVGSTAKANIKVSVAYGNLTIK